MYSNIQTSVMNNGHLTQFFNISRGIRQGCPLSAYLFLFVVEIMANSIRKNNNIKGFQLKNKTLKISQLADDTTIMVKDYDSLIYLFQILESFRKCSGLKTNIEKTKAYTLGKKTYNNKPKLNLKWETGPINLLGITITDNPKVNKEANILPKIKQIKNTLNVWKQRQLSLKGKITIINS